MNSMLRRLALAAALTVGAGAVLAYAEGGGDLVVFDWSGYEDPLLHPDYTAKYGAEPTFAFFGDEEEAFQKMRAGFKADIAHPCSQSVVKWREAGMLQPLDTVQDRRLEGPQSRHHGDEGSRRPPPTARPGSCRSTGATRRCSTAPTR